ncbi:PEP-CTERM sorting domain-containing protein [Crocosphaera chwakensis]|uniref:Ice-binding protein C-terminal domain-containing protein n=1 Tax=Crocosphaera chwakensis CCY0110 TaxID=391612 RepID=A3IXK0_9CHRO|nr:PEP-CTERM sorting domain-containing protein [Crocosphaera chwakensis]EAZ88802.1 hypothetical protein CY0110_01075 [Crocosphaera chwakensis CCY0110]
MKMIHKVITTGLAAGLIFTAVAGEAEARRRGRWSGYSNIFGSSEDLGNNEEGIKLELFEDSGDAYLSIPLNVLTGVEENFFEGVGSFNVYLDVSSDFSPDTAELDMRIDVSDVLTLKEDVLQNRDPDNQDDIIQILMNSGYIDSNGSFEVEVDYDVELSLDQFTSMQLQEIAANSRPITDSFFELSASQFFDLIENDDPDNTIFCEPSRNLAQILGGNFDDEDNRSRLCNHSDGEAILVYDDGFVFESNKDDDTDFNFNDYLIEFEGLSFLIETDRDGNKSFRDDLVVHNSGTGGEGFILQSIITEPDEPESVPEPATNAGLIALGLLGIGALGKGKFIKRKF